MMEVNLEQLLKVVEKLNPAEIAILRERIHLTQHSASVKPSTETSQRDEFFTLPFKQYLALSDEERELIQLSVYQSKNKWIDAELKRRKAEWISMWWRSCGMLRDIAELSVEGKIDGFGRRVRFCALCVCQSAVA